MIKYCKHLKDLDSIETLVSCCEKKICEAQISTVKRMKVTLDALALCQSKLQAPSLKMLFNCDPYHLISLLLLVIFDKMLYLHNSCNTIKNNF